MNNRWVFSLSSLPLSRCHSPHLRARAQLFDRDKAGRGLVFFFLLFFFCADYWMLFEAFPKGWSYSEKGFLFLWCSSIIHRPFFYGLVSALEGLSKPGCIWIISLWSSPSRELHQPSRVHWRQINTRTLIHRQFGQWDCETKGALGCGGNRKNKISWKTNGLVLLWSLCGVSQLYCCDSYVFKGQEIYSSTVETFTIQAWKFWERLCPPLSQ